MTAYWNNLNERERLVLVLGAIVCAISLFYALIYSPLKQAIYTHTQQLIEKKETLAWLEQMHQQYKPQSATQKLSSTQLLRALTEALDKSPLKSFNYQLQQTGASDIQLSFEQAPYHAFIQWLWSMNQQYSMSIKQLNIEHTKTTGVVKIGLIVT